MKSEDSSSQPSMTLDASRAPPRDPGGAPSYALIALIAGVTATATYFGFELSRAGTVTLWFILGAPTIAFASFALLRAHRDGELRSWIRPVWGDATIGIGSAAVLMCGAAIFVHLVAPVGSDRESWMARLYLQLGSPDTLRSHSLALGAAIVIIAAAEEIVWRGLVTTLLAEKLGSRSAWVIAAFLYAASMLPAMWSLRDPVAGLNPILPLAGLCLGLLWGTMSRYTRRLTPAILSHAAFDWCVIVLFRLWGPSL